ncbi:MAG TPA: hypothetical protein VH299_04305, partial [Solirubrobacterales bacterium]|nr:hypothetical protein [Solirubrobacterales bacterium]
DDLIRGIVSLAESDVHTPVNIGNPNEFTLLELAKAVIEVTESRSEIGRVDPARRHLDSKRRWNRRRTGGRTGKQRDYDLQADRSSRRRCCQHELQSGGNQTIGYLSL